MVSTLRLGSFRGTSKYMLYEGPEVNWKAVVFFTGFQEKAESMAFLACA